MLWQTLWNKIGKQPIKFTAHNHVYAEIWNEQTGKHEKRYLMLKYDVHACPYLVEDLEMTKNKSKPMQGRG